MNAFLQTLRSLGPLRLAAVAGVSLLLIGFFVYLMTRLSAGDMALLYSDLEAGDSADIVAELDSLQVPYTLRDGGATILVPEDQVDRLRLAMAREGLPSGGSIGYEIFDNGDGFGTTSFQQTMNRQRALEGELARTIGAMANVRQARVRLVLPERELFSRDRAEPSASVFLSLDRGGIAPDQVAAVQHLVAASVLRLQPSSVAVIDDRGNVLATGPGTDEEATLLTSAEQLRAARERQLREQIEALLARSVGVGHVRAEVAIEMDYDRVITNSEIYDPESQVAISSQFVEEESSSNEGDGLDPVTVAGNLPEAEDLPAIGEPSANSQTSRTEETTNFVVSRTVEDRVREGGVIRRLSVAVMVDGRYTEDADGNLIYEPRDEGELSQMAALVRSAIGYDSARGDSVEVANMRFASEEEMFPERAQAGPLGMTTDELFRLAEILVLGVVAVLVILLVVRPLLVRALDGSSSPDSAEDELDGLLTDQTGLQRALAGPGMSGTGTPELAVPAESDTAELDALIDIGQVEGRVRASSLRKVGEIIEKHPEEAASIIRNWLYQGA